MRTKLILFLFEHISLNLFIYRIYLVHPNKKCGFEGRSRRVTEFFHLFYDAVFTISTSAEQQTCCFIYSVNGGVWCCSSLDLLSSVTQRLDASFGLRQVSQVSPRRPLEEDPGPLVL